MILLTACMQQSCVMHGVCEKKNMYHASQDLGNAACTTAGEWTGKGFNAKNMSPHLGCEPSFILPQEAGCFLSILARCPHSIKCEASKTTDLDSQKDRVHPGTVLQRRVSQPGLPTVQTLADTVSRSIASMNSLTPAQKRYAISRPRKPRPVFINRSG
jgi:hypothetical protein